MPIGAVGRQAEQQLSNQAPLLPLALPAAPQVVINDLKAPIPPYFELFKVHHAIGGDAEIFYREVATNPDFNVCREVRAGRVATLVAWYRGHSKNAFIWWRGKAVLCNYWEKKETAHGGKPLCGRLHNARTCGAPRPRPCCVALAWGFVAAWKPGEPSAIAFKEGSHVSLVHVPPAHMLPARVPPAPPLARPSTSWSARSSRWRPSWPTTCSRTCPCRWVHATGRLLAGGQQIGMLGFQLPEATFSRTYQYSVVGIVQGGSNGRPTDAT